MFQKWKNKEGILGKDIYTDLDNAIRFDNDDIVVTEGTQGFFQRIYNKLLSFFYSLYLHPSWGGLFQPYVSTNMTYNMVNNLNSRGKQTILEEPEVLNVPKFEVEVYPDINQLRINAYIDLITDLDTQEIQKTLNVDFN